MVEIMVGMVQMVATVSMTTTCVLPIWCSTHFQEGPPLPATQSICQINPSKLTMLSRGYPIQILFIKPKTILCSWVAFIFPMIKLITILDRGDLARLLFKGGVQVTFMTHKEQYIVYVFFFIHCWDYEFRKFKGPQFYRSCLGRGSGA